VRGRDQLNCPAGFENLEINKELSSVVAGLGVQRDYRLRHNCVREMPEVRSVLVCQKTIRIERLLFAAVRRNAWLAFPLETKLKTTRDLVERPVLLCGRLRPVFGSKKTRFGSIRFQLPLGAGCAWQQTGEEFFRVCFGCRAKSARSRPASAVLPILPHRLQLVGFSSD